MDELYQTILKTVGKQDCQHENLYRLAHVGSDTGCRGCGIVMKAREWPEFKKRQADKGG